ncbi:MAG: aminotransferase class I/II-fold pyridoxal phosphate-dependent enzyme, partial [Alphaproteobacteria bacterium]|nr:aminotransferase class I/II-fold pyridoxal phosphate-dependent enzyme [Alphaproteobacteria bacterium]
MSKNFPDASPETLAVQALGVTEPLTGAVTPPVYISSTFEREPDLEYKNGFIYGRADNQTVRQAEAVLTTLEGGVASLLVASGMSAATGVFMALKPGDTALVPEVMYWGVRKWLNSWGAEWGVKIVYYPNDDMTTLRALTEQHRPALIWAETPSNPMWSVTDIAEAA